jgi:hypothetical protein
MIPTPIAVGLMLCEHVVVEEGTRHISMINTFARWKVGPFPSTPRPFYFVATMVDGEGNGTIELAVTQEDDADSVYEARHSVRFPDRLKETRAIFRVNNCSFPAAGLYYATLSVDGEWVAQKRFQIY